ncbi:nucleotide pyrophosphohydrolase [Candidatus Woesearchaeota archaeon]|nr:nucleotide pyrophosphohydrolase [Candidatus Woesearchaeota archaeon]
MHDAKTSINELKELAEKFREERDWKQFHTPKDMAMNIVIEGGELLEHFRYRTNDEIRQFLSNPDKMKEISNEIADVLLGLLYLSTDLNIDIASAFDEKLRLSAKKYPIEKAKGVNKKYTEL